MWNFVEVVVNRPIIQRRKLTKGEQTKLAWYEQVDTRLKTFHYHLPPHLMGQIRPGHLVAVPFRRQMLQGVVVALDDSAPVEYTRPVHALLSPEPIVSLPQIALAQWLAKEYLAPLATCLAAFFPPGSNREPITMVSLISPPPTPLPDLNARERALQLYLQQKGRPVPLEELEAKVVEMLVEKGIAQKRAALSKPKVGPRIERTIELTASPDEFDDILNNLGYPSKQAEILRYLNETDDPLPSQETVLTTVGCSQSPLNALVEKGWLDYLPPQQFIVAVPKAKQADPTALSASQQTLLTALITAAKPVEPETLNLTEPNLNDDVNHLLKLGMVNEILEPQRVTLKLARAEITEAIINLRRVTRHADVLNLLTQEDGPIWIGWVYAQTDATKKTLDDLAQAGAITQDKARYWRDPLADKTFTLDKAPNLTVEQAEILEQIWPALTSYKKPFLIHGVTGSGKTEIYLQAIERILAQKRGIIFLVPEIFLATQIVGRVQARFPDKVAVWHSALSPGERFDTWERVYSGELPIVVGPRSALFAPIHNLGLIIVDEEHEPAYKAYEGGPTFHTRDAAIELARLSDIAIIMGSATPDVVSYRKAQRGEYQLLTLPNRILAHKDHLAVQQTLVKRHKQAGKEASSAAPIALPPDKPFVSLPMPPVEVVDLREELKAGNRSIFSRTLVEAIEKTLKAGEQVILFLNRRGTATFINCRDCGFVMDCPQCDTTLTFHAPNTQLVCHYCAYQTDVPNTCPKCHSKRIRYFGLGTERVEATLRRTIPQANPIRLDQDTTRKQGSHYILLQHFVEGRANVMIGTQMVAKGLDLPLVTLVGVISADTALYLPDFRSAERTFQVLMQVAGRAGRSPLGGRVILQTYTPDQPAIIAAANHDYLTFYDDELRFRYEQGYPPFKRLARLMFSGSGREKSLATVEEMARRLRLWVAQQGFPAVEIIGPTPAYVHRIRSKYRWQIIVRAPDPAEVLRAVPLPLGWKVDIDPVSLL